MSNTRKRRHGSRAANKRRLEAAVQAIQQRWGSQALNKGMPPSTEGTFPEGKSAATAVPSLSTGLPTLDAILVTGGVPMGHISELIGQPTSGKRTLALHILARAQQDHPCAYIDLAQTFDPAYAAGCHVDLSRLAIVAPTDPVQALDLACDLTVGGHFGLVVFDSTSDLLLGAFAPGAPAVALRRLRHHLAGQASALLFLTTAFFDQPGSAHNYPAGFDLGQAAALRLVMSRQRWLRRYGIIRGYEAQVAVLRSRWSRPGQQALVRIAFNGVHVQGNASP